MPVAVSLLFAVRKLELSVHVVANDRETHAFDRLLAMFFMRWS